MDTHDVLRQELVAPLVRTVEQEENEIESGQQRGAEFDVFAHTFAQVVMPTNRVRRGDDGRTGGETAHNPSFGNGDLLLFHRLVGFKKQSMFVVVVVVVESVEEWNVAVEEWNAAVEECPVEFNTTEPSFTGCFLNRNTLNPKP
jgi:hypothetical protein